MMIERVAMAAAMAAMLMVAAPAPGAAQSVLDPDGWWGWAAPVVAGGEMISTRRGGMRLPDRVEDILRGPEARRGPGARGQAARQGQGPPFCRNNQGHPVHGREWCRAKGWSATWQRTVWDDVGIRLPRDRRGGTLRPGTLGEVIDRVVLGRLDERRARLGVHGPMEGRWLVTPEGARVLQVRADGVPIAELTDLDGDGRVDLVLLNEG
jgi:hypothetical protein